MLEDCGPVVVSPLQIEEFDSLEYVLLGCRRSSGNNDVEGSDAGSVSSDAFSNEGSDVDGSSTSEDEHWWSESEWSESIDGLITMNSARSASAAANAFNNPAASLSLGPEHNQQQRQQPEPSTADDNLRADTDEGADDAARKRVAPRKREVVAMLFENLKNSVFKRRSAREPRGTRNGWARSPRTARVHTTVSTAPSLSSTRIDDDQEPWSSSSRRFTSLKHFVWQGGAPQFAFSVSASTGNVVVRDVLSSDSAVSGILVGDVLEAVADVLVRGMDLDEVSILLSTVNTPAVFRFRAVDSKTHTAKRWEFEQFHAILRDQMLGATFTSDGPRHIPVVSRLAMAGAPAAAFGIRPSDVLVAVNGQDAIAMGLGRVLKFVTSAPRPICFTFQRVRAVTGSAGRRPAAPQRSVSQTHGSAWRHTEASGAGGGSDVLIVWKSGPLGVTLVPDLLSGLPVVNRLTGKGTSRGLEHVHPGYLLHSVNGRKMANSRMDEWQAELSALRKPALLVFKAVKTTSSFSNDDSGSDSNSGSGSLTFASPSASPRAPLEMVETAATDQILASLATYRLTGIGGSRSDLETLDFRGALDSDDCYLVMWSEPRLGLGLSLEPRHHRFPLADDDDDDQTSSPLPLVPVVRVVQSSCRLQFPGNPLGDWLVSVNGAPTTGLTEAKLRKLAASASKPAGLRFHRPPPRPSTVSCQGDASASSPAQWWNELHDSDEEESTPRLPTELAATAPLTTTHYCYNLLWPSGSALGLTFASYLDADRGGQVVIYVKRVAPSGHAAKTRLVARGDELATVNAAALPSRGFDATMQWLARQKRPLVLGFARPLVERDGARS